MKKLLAAMCAVLLVGSASTSVSAETQEETGVVVSQATEYLEDGSSVEIVVRELPTMTRAASSKTGSKTYTKKNSSGDVLWEFVEKGTFSVDKGVSSTCTAASHTYSIKNSAWKNTKATSKKSGNQAIGDGTFEQKLLGIITVDTVNCHVVLTCDKNGKLT